MMLQFAQPINNTLIVASFVHNVHGHQLMVNTWRCNRLFQRLLHPNVMNKHLQIWEKFDKYFTCCRKCPKFSYKFQFLRISTYKCYGWCDFGSASRSTDKHRIIISIEDNDRAHGWDWTLHWCDKIGRRRWQAKVIDFSRRWEIIHFIIQKDAGVSQ